MADYTAEVGIKERPGYIRLAPEVLVIGGGIAGITLTQSLARAGIRVTIIENSKEFGGKASGHCFYSENEDIDNRWLQDGISQLAHSSSVTMIAGAQLTSLSGQFGTFTAHIKTEGGETVALKPAIVAVTTGYATERKAPGPSVPLSISYLPDLAAHIASDQQKLMWQGKPVSSVTIILDQVNDDIKIDAVSVLKMVLVLRERFNCQVSVLCRDLKVSFAAGERLYRKAREEGVLFFKYDDPPHYEENKHGKISLRLIDTSMLTKETPERITLVSDLLVLPETCLPGRETETLCRILDIPIDGKRGYMMDDNPQFSRIRSNRRGIYLAGACRFPQDIAETMAEAEAAAEEITALLAPGIYEYAPMVAEVDAAKCALCYTCPRICPHRAISIEKYAAGNVYRFVDNGGDIIWQAARVEPAACYGCGICVAECPARAIHLCDEAPLPAFAALPSIPEKG